MQIVEEKAQILKIVHSLLKSRAGTSRHAPPPCYGWFSPRKVAPPTLLWSFPSMADLLVGLIFVLMVLAPAIVASLQSASWSDEEE